MVCCRAFFCCKTGNTVSKEAELAQIKLAATTASAAKGEKDAGLEATTTNFPEPTVETQPLISAPTGKSEAIEKEKQAVAPVEETKTEVADEEQ